MPLITVNEQCRLHHFEEIYRMKLVISVVTEAFRMKRNNRYALICNGLSLAIQSNNNRNVHDQLMNKYYLRQSCLSYSCLVEKMDT